MSDGHASRDVQMLVKAWLDATRDRDTTERRLRDTEHDLALAAQTLGRLIAPKDLSFGEKIGVWCRLDDHCEVIVLVSIVSEGSPFDQNSGRVYVLELRTRAPVAASQ